MKTFCIPKAIALELKNRVKSGSLDIKKVIDMKSVERKKYFSELTNKDIGEFMNLSLEKAIASSKKESLQNWANMVFKGKGKDNITYKKLTEKIKGLNENELLSNEPGIVDDLVMDKLGISITKDEGAKITTLAEKIQKIETDLGDNLDDVSFYNASKENKDKVIDFWKTKSEMEDYLNSLSPSSFMKQLTDVYSKASLLFSAKTGVLNLVSNTSGGLVKMIERRIVNASLRSGIDKKIYHDYIKMSLKIYKESSFDVTRTFGVESSSMITGEKMTQDRKSVV